jgi:prepilin-type N-terminal cleavage/methylation domain-containing protein
VASFLLYLADPFLYESNMEPGLKWTARAAFTLVELLVTVTVIGILAALLLPALGRAKDKAVRTHCLSNLRQFNLGILIYGGDNHDRLPTLHGGLWPWDLPYSVADILLQNSVTRAVLYDPGFPEMNTDGLWNYAPFSNVLSGPYRVIGYAMTFPGTAGLSRTNWNPSLVPQSTQVNGVDIPAQSPSTRVLTAGAVISAPGQNNPDLRATYQYTGIYGGYRLLPHRCAHLIGKFPAGDNLGMCDGHVEWRQFTAMNPRTSDWRTPTFWW